MCVVPAGSEGSDALESNVFPLLIVIIAVAVVAAGIVCIVLVVVAIFCCYCCRKREGNCQISGRRPPY